MTARKDLKRRIRERQARTNESYTTARRHVLAAAPDRADDPAAAEPDAPEPGPALDAATPDDPETRGAPARPDAAAAEMDTRFGAEAAGDQPGRAIVVEEMVDLTVEAEALGFCCRVMLSSALAKLVDRATLLQRMHDVLDGTADDPAMERMRAVCLRGESPRSPARVVDWLESLRQFVARARVGVGGLAIDGAMLAFNVDGVMILANTGFRPVPVPHPERPRLIFSAIVEEGFTMSMLYVR